MSIGINSYGAADEVAALTPRFADATTVKFTTTTRPTLAQVERWIDRVSATLNILLAENGFAIPVTQADARSALDQFVVTSVADLTNYANSAGRFFSDKNLNTGPFQAIQKEAADFISRHAEGLAQIGATRTRGGLNGLAFCETDDAGNAIEPMFARKQFGTANTDWDT